jgi:hypothetical protein
MYANPDMGEGALSAQTMSAAKDEEDPGGWDVTVGPPVGELISRRLVDH